MDLIVYGISHQTASIKFLNKVTFLREDYPRIYAELLSLPGIQEVTILSTCNRSEIYAVVLDEQEGIRTLKTFYLDYFDLPGQEASAYFYHHANDKMVRHLFSVIGGLNSLVIGETQISGQVREAYRLAAQFGGTKTILNRLFHKAFEVNKKVRVETKVGSGVVSVGHAAVQLAEKIFYPIQNCRALVIGAGETAALTARHLQQAGVKNITVTNRTLQKAQDLAERVEGKAVPFEQVMEHLIQADIVITATSSPEPLFVKEDIQKILKIRQKRNLFLIDIAVPYDLDPEIREFDGIYLYDIDDLKQIVAQNRASREREAEKAVEIIKIETVDFLNWIKNLQINPTIQKLRRRFEEILEKEFKQYEHKFPEEQWPVAEEMTRRIVNKILHLPTVKLKELYNNPDGIHKISVIKQFFDLE